MTSRLIAAAAFAAMSVSSSLSAADDLASQLPGVWKRTDHVQKIVATGETSKPMGDKPGGMAIFTRGGHFTFILIADGRKSPASLPPTDPERIALFSTSFFGGGTFRIAGDKVTLLYANSANQAWTGVERTQTMEVSGKTLTWTSGPIKSADGKDAVATFTFERLE